jgi:signal transduction histidine kinase
LTLPFAGYAINRHLRLHDANKNLNHFNAELQEANTQLIQLDQMKTQFVSQASHDLRTPLTAIKGSLDNLLMGIAGALNEKQQKVMTRATTSVDRLTNLINDVLDLNRIETGRIVLEKSDIPFKALVDNIVNENRPAADQKQIQLAFVASDGDCILHIDGSKIERVVGELISNAIKYTPDDGTVDVGLSCTEDMVSLSVKDSGIGMTNEECGKIWERFYRTTASKKFAKGSGLGLSIAKELVELHGGELTVASKQESGTTFYMALPFNASKE